MSGEKKEKDEKPVLACEVCLREIGREEAETYEVDDYVHHFCGLDCYSKWQRPKAPGGPEKKKG